MFPIKSRLCAKHRPFRFPKGKTVEEKDGKGIFVMEMDVKRKWTRGKSSLVASLLAPRNGFRLLLTDVCVGLLFLTGNRSRALLANKNTSECNWLYREDKIIRVNEVEIKHSELLASSYVFSKNKNRKPTFWQNWLHNVSHTINSLDLHLLC